MVPGSTLRYGSNFSRFTLNPRLSSRQPIEADANPLPKDETTPPVTKMNFLSIYISPSLLACRFPTIHFELQQHECGTRVPTLVVAPIAQRFPTGFVQVSRTFSGNRPGKRTDPG